MGFDLLPRYRDDVVVNFTFFEIRVYSHEFDVLRAVFGSTTVLDDLFQADARPPCRSCPELAVSGCITLSLFYLWRPHPTFIQLSTSLDHDK